MKTLAEKLEDIRQEMKRELAEAEVIVPESGNGLIVLRLKGSVAVGDFTLNAVPDQRVNGT